ncbi:MAG: hypothetical protein HY673_04530 [Chloroflexi bacterium]|nr:hypothetical protein [Chloroflexota bacterium]
MIKSTARIRPQKILSDGAIKLLQQFTSKGYSREFRVAFENMIAEMDATPDLTPEAKALFHLELLLHEADDGFRDMDEAYTYARDLLEAERPARCESRVRCPKPPH